MSGKARVFRTPGVPAKVMAAGLIITGLFVGTTFLWLLPSAEQALIGRKKEKIKEATEIAWSVLESYHRQEVAGILTRDAAQQAASRMVEGIRFGPEMKDYFWINDTLPRMVMHPYRTDLNGRDVTDFRDPNGKAMFAAFADMAVRHGEGFVDYLWQWQDDNGKIVPKISYVRLFRPWGWVLGTGMYIEDVRAEIGRWKVGIIILYCLLALTGLVLSGLVGRQVAAALRRPPGSEAAGGAREQERDSAGFSVSLRTFVLSVMVPLLLILTVYWSFDLFRDLYGIILEGFDARLYGVSSTTGIYISGSDHAVIEQSRSEQDPLYIKYAVPMRRILERTGLTYLYTQILVDRTNTCVYMIDATPGEEHSEIGTRDKLDPADYNASLKVLLHGVVHISDVDHTDNWGMLKYAYAPIWNGDGTVRAIAGADVNIEAIRLKTRAALFAVFVMAVIALVLGAYLSLLISHSLTRPIAQLKKWALHMAAGSYGEAVAIERPYELKMLAQDFGRVGTAMERTMHALRQDRRQAEESELAYRLALELDQRHLEDISRSGPRGTYRFSYLNRTGGGKTASGAVATEDGAVCWIGVPAVTGLEAVRIRSDIYGAVERLAATGADAAAAVAGLYAESIAAAVSFSSAGGEVRIRPLRPFTWLAVPAAGGAELKRTEREERFMLEPGQSLFFWDSATVPYGEPSASGIEEWLPGLQAAAAGSSVQIFTGVIRGTDAG